jgi:hypothetical protein
LVLVVGGVDVTVELFEAKRITKAAIRLSILRGSPMRYERRHKFVSVDDPKVTAPGGG